MTSVLIDTLTVTNSSLSLKAEFKQDSTTRCKILTEDGQPITLLLHGGDKIPAKGFFCFGLRERKNKETGEPLPLSIGISVERDFGQISKIVAALEKAVQNLTGKSPRPILSQSSTVNAYTGELNPPVLNMRVKYSKQANKITSVFQYEDSTTPMENPLSELNQGFKGVYYVDIEGASYGEKTDTWYINLILHSCMVHKKPPPRTYF